jgi:hypothetical protein
MYKNPVLISLSELLLDRQQPHTQVATQDSQQSYLAACKKSGGDSLGFVPTCKHQSQQNRCLLISICARLCWSAPPTSTILHLLRFSLLSTSLEHALYLHSDFTATRHLHRNQIGHTTPNPKIMIKDCESHAQYNAHCSMFFISNTFPQSHGQQQPPTATNSHDICKQPQHRSYS